MATRKQRPTVLLSYPIHRKLIDELLKPRARVLIARNREQFEKWAPQADALIIRFSDRIDSDFLSRADRLKAIGCYSVGTDQVDLRACHERGIGVTHTPDVLTRATAELTLALLLAAARRIPEGLELCKSGDFEKRGGWAPDLLLGQELKGRQAVLVGRGRIGKETERLFRGIGLRTAWITRQSSVRQISELLSQAQILSLHVPLSPETRHWLNAAKIKLLPRDAIVLNTTRGPVVDETALVRALKTHRIFAAGLDVYEREPKIPAVLRNLPNVVLLPHVGSATENARSSMARLTILGILAILSGKRPGNLVEWQQPRHEKTNF